VTGKPDPIIDKRRAGATCAAIASDTGVSYRKVELICRLGGLAGDDVGCPAGRRLDPNEALRLRESGASFAEIGAYFKVSRTATWTVVRRAEARGQRRAA